MNPYVVIDIGGTSIKYGLADAKGQLLETHEMPTEAQKGGPHILNTTKEIVARYLKKHPLAGVAISSAGMVDPDKGEIFYAGPQIPNYAGTQFKKEIEETFQIPCGHYRPCKRIEQCCLPDNWDRDRGLPLA